MTSMKYVKQIERLMKFVLFSDLVSLTVKMVIDSKDNVKLYFQPSSFLLPQHLFERSKGVSGIFLLGWICEKKSLKSSITFEPELSYASELLLMQRQVEV